MGANVNELGVVKVAKPCHRDWQKMSGDARARFCADCQLTVYDLSAMTTDEARELIREKEGQLCVRFFSRADGTVLTKDCPVGVKLHRKKLIAAGAAVASLSVAALAFAVTQAFDSAESEPVAQPWPVMPEPAQAECEAAPEKPEGKAADDRWIEQRRNQLGPRERAPGQHVMGRMQIIKVGGDQKP